MSHTITFVREALANYSSIGSPVPSSHYLAESMVAALGEIPTDKPIIELGPGTGAFTRLLLDTFPDNPVYGVEWNARFAELLREKYPRFQIVQCCASKMCEPLGKLGIEPGTIGGILSGLPLMSFKKDLRQAIFAEIHRALAPGAPYIQMTYYRMVWKRIHPPGLARRPDRRVWRNFPPAAVLSFHKNGQS